MKKYIRYSICLASVALLAISNCISTDETVDSNSFEHLSYAEGRDSQIIKTELNVEQYDKATSYKNIEYTELPFTLNEVEMLAKTVWGEARGCTKDEQRLVVWTVLQRVDNDYWACTINEVLTEDRQFVGYCDTNPIDEEIYELCYEELLKWHNNEEPPTHEVFASSTPYYFFTGDGKHNWFSEEWK